MKPVGYARQRFLDGENCGIYLPLSPDKLYVDDVPLYTVAPLSQSEVEALKIAISMLRHEAYLARADVLQTLLERQK